MRYGEHLYSIFFLTIEDRNRLKLDGEEKVLN